MRNEAMTKIELYVTTVRYGTNTPWV